MTLEDDLEYLAKEAFEFSLEINPDAGAHLTVTQVIEEKKPDDDNWASPDQLELAVKTGRLVIGYVYPNGSVSFYRIFGAAVGPVIKKCAELCRAKRQRYAAASKSTDDAEDPELASLTARLNGLLPDARLAAHYQGSTHPWWDVIYDAEHAIKGKPTLMEGTRIEVMREAARVLSLPIEPS